MAAAHAAALFIIGGPMKSKDNRISLRNGDDSLIYLASAVVYSGVINEDVNFSVLNGPKSFLTVLALKRTPSTGII